MRKPWVKEDWDTVDITKPGWIIDGEQHFTWSYRRYSHPWIWAIFGNDNDGVTPCFRGEVWSWWDWWLRNSFHAFKWYVLGLAHWEEALIPYSSHENSHLERLYVCEWDWFGLSLVRHCKDYESSWRKHLWHPFIYIGLPFDLAFWVGWKPNRGQFALSLKVDD